MWTKIKALPLLAYMSVTGAIRDLRNDEKGLSGVVVAILLILVAVLAVGIIWGFLSGWLSDLWARITGADAAIA